MILCFTLTMPRNNSWNGQWSGQDNFYAITKNLGRTKEKLSQAQEILKVGSYSYNFGDGWVARVEVSQVDSPEAAKIRRRSKGFCGYNWMVTSIIKNGDIRVE